MRLVFPTSSKSQWSQTRNLCRPAAKVTPGKSRCSELRGPVTWRAQAGCGLITQLGQDACVASPEDHCSLALKPSLPGLPHRAQGMSKGDTVIADVKILALLL